jgi:hypothetical protein
MPLDPLVKAFLDRAAQIPRPKVWDIAPVMARQSFAGMMQLTGPKDVAVGKMENFTIPGPGGDIPARLLTEHLPVLAMSVRLEDGNEQLRLRSVVRVHRPGAETGLDADVGDARPVVPLEREHARRRGEELRPGLFRSDAGFASHRLRVAR